jgi:hypothetical protein
MKNDRIVDDVTNQNIPIEEPHLVNWVEIPD